MPTINTTYQPGGMTTQTEGIAGGGGRGRGGGGGFGFDSELMQLYRDRAAESAADRARQRRMDQQRFEWEKQAQLKANPPSTVSGPDPDFDLKQSAKTRQLMENQAAMRTPQRELQFGMGKIGGYGGPDIQSMNAIERGLYAPANAVNAPEKDEQAAFMRSQRLAQSLWNPGGVGG